MYKSESVLGLIGSILGAIATFLYTAGVIIIAFFYNTIEPVVHGFLNNFLCRINIDYCTFIGTLAGSLFIICAAIGFVIAAASFILGFIGTSKLNKGSKNGGVLLIIAAGLALISVVGFVPFVLMLIGGIMAVSKKESV